MKMRNAHGFTLMELMVTLFIAAIIVGIAVPNMRDFSRNNRLSSGVNELLRSLQLARNEAIKRQIGGAQSIIVCASADPVAATPACGFAGLPFQGWIVFHDVDGDWQYDAGETLIEQHNLIDAAVSVKTDNSSVVSYSMTGFANIVGPGGEVPTTMVLMCDDRGNQLLGATDSTARAIAIDQTGRARVTRRHSTIALAIANDGTLACPN